MICYKVVRIERDSLLSVNLKLPIHYRIGKWTQPKLKGSKLFVFATLENAKRFVNSYVYEMHIYKCEAIGVSKPKYCAQLFHDVKKFWIESLNKRELMIVPHGTRWATKIKLLTRVA